MQNAREFNQDVSDFHVKQVYQMGSMVEGATSFSQDLNAWSGEIHEFVNVAHMFEGTACPDQNDPNLKTFPKGPFCI
jgi:hypothetical protein